MRRRTGRLRGVEDLPPEFRPDGWRHWLEEGEEANGYGWYLALHRRRPAVLAWCKEHGVSYRREYLPLVHPEWYPSTRGAVRRAPTT